MEDRRRRPDATARRIDREGPFDADRHVADHEVKAVTHHGSKVEREGDAWVAEVILDI